MGCSQHKLYVIGADEEQFDQLEKKLKHSGIKVIKQNNLSSEFEQLTLVSAIAFPIGTVEAALDQIVYTTLAQGGNQFYTHSAGLYYPSYQPKLVDIYTNSCNSHLITLSTFQGNFYKLTVEQFIESEQGYEYITVGEYQGTFNIINKIMSAASKDNLVFKAHQYFETTVQADGLEFLTTTIPQIKLACKIIKRKNHS
jgi:hypothetical protein